MRSLASVLPVPEWLRVSERVSDRAIRRVDADEPEVPRALLEEIEASDWSRESADGGSGDQRSEAFVAMLEALLQGGCRDGSIAEQAREIVRRIVQRDGETA